jgi:hypothetical protein
MCPIESVERTNYEVDESSPFNCVKVSTMFSHQFKKYNYSEQAYFEFTLRGGHDSLEGKPGVVKLLASWLFFMPTGGSMSIRN